ncbi:hypothetical protein BJ508DRAFT_321789 [Ascobolus immersus RN42]|uniref:Uncharacterized protein n=1 Tax=Ascobolus immersus RN42 TaxID=1160509 RepID=A0A3N4IIZ0_ASCIM|nr:hypothetical protein BJ508DRAFT_321789 [Ascobolus immersus RN42]
MELARNRMGQQTSRLYSPLEPPQLQTGYSAHQLSSPMGYQPDYSQETPRQQSYPSYGSSMEYGMPQAATSSYATYPARQTTSMNSVLPNQISQFTTQYYVPSEPSTPVSAISTIPPPPPPSQPQYSPVGYEQARYTSNYIAPPTMSQQAAEPLPDYGQTQQQTHLQREQPQQQQQQLQATSQMDTEDAYSEYQRALHETYQMIRDGRLSTAGTSLLKVSEWLLSNAVTLGLVRDEKALHAYRTRMWDEFNLCWITCLRKQKDLLQEGILATELQPARDLLQVDALKKMGDDLVRLCDSLEKHGLVDYQFGVWEEEIIDELQECLDLMEGRRGSDSTPGAPPTQNSTSPSNTTTSPVENAYGLDRHTGQTSLQSQQTQQVEGSSWGTSSHANESQRLNQHPTSRV